MNILYCQKYFTEHNCASLVCHYLGLEDFLNTVNDIVSSSQKVLLICYDLNHFNRIKFSINKRHKVEYTNKDSLNLDGKFYDFIYDEVSSKCLVVDEPYKIDVVGINDCVLEIPKNINIKSNIGNFFKKEVVIDSGIKDVISLMWENDIQTQGCCYGHKYNDKECVAWVQVAQDSFAQACRIIDEIQFEKPICIMCDSFMPKNRFCYFSKNDFDILKLGNWSLHFISGSLILTSQ